jgi:hypothetical protein
MALWYILIQRLCNGQPTALEADINWFLFNSEGVTMHTANSPNPELGRDVWVLVDSNPVVQQPAPVFLGGGCTAFIIQATSPQHSRYHDWSKEWLTTMWTMDNWSLRELEFCAQVCCKTS